MFTAIPFANAPAVPEPVSDPATKTVPVATASAPAAPPCTITYFFVTGEEEASVISKVCFSVVPCLNSNSSRISTVDPRAVSPFALSIPGAAPVAMKLIPTVFDEAPTLVKSVSPTKVIVYLLSTVKAFAAITFVIRPLPFSDTIDAEAFADFVELLFVSRCLKSMAALRFATTSAIVVPRLTTTLDPSKSPVVPSILKT